MTGIPDSGDTEALDILFRQYDLAGAATEVPSYTPTPGIRFYELVCSQDHEQKVLYRAAEPHTCYFNAAYSAVKQKYNLTNQSIEMHQTNEKPPILFADPLLESSFNKLYSGFEHPDPLLESKYGFKRYLPKGLAFMNMWNIGSSKSVFYFLPFLSNQLSSNYFWLFFDLCRDAENMHLPPVFPENHLDWELLMIWRSRLYYLLRNVYYQTAGAKKEKNRRQCNLFCTSNCTDQSRHTHIMKECKEAISQLAKEIMKIQHHIRHDEIVELTYSRVHADMLSSQPLKLAADNAIAEGFRLRSNSKIRLSWIFLRKAFYENDDLLYIAKESLRNKSSELNMSEGNFEKFCRFFSSFGSIIDASKLGPESQYIILRPVEFFLKLDKLLYHNTEFVRTYGLVTESVLHAVYQADAEFFINVLLTANLATTVSKDQILLEEKNEAALRPYTGKLYYVPIACNQKSIRTCHHSALHLQITGHVLCRNIHATFTEKLLELDSSCRIVFKSGSNANCNRTSYAYKTMHFDMTCHGNEIEFLLDDSLSDYAELDLYEIIINSCYNMVKHFIEKEVTFKLNFSFLCCLASSANQQFRFDRKRHQLPLNSAETNDLCEPCKRLMSTCKPLQMWNGVLGTVSLILSMHCDPLLLES